MDLFDLHRQSPHIEDHVWLKAIPLPNLDSNMYRLDVYNHIIQKDKYGDTTHKYGWEIDHCLSKSYCKREHIDLNIANSFINLQPLNIELNRFWNKYVIKIHNHQQYKKKVIIFWKQNHFIGEYPILAKILKNINY